MNINKSVKSSNSNTKARKTHWRWNLTRIHNRINFYFLWNYRLANVDIPYIMPTLCTHRHYTCTFYEFCDWCAKDCRQLFSFLERVCVCAEVFVNLKSNFLPTLTWWMAKLEHIYQNRNHSIHPSLVKGGAKNQEIDRERQSEGRKVCGAKTCFLSTATVFINVEWINRWKRRCVE